MYKQNRSQQPIYPQDIQCVADPINGKGAVFIGNLQASQNIRTLIKHKIGAVLTAAKSIKLNHPKNHVPYHLYIPGQDHQRFDLSVYFDQAIQFIQMARQKTNILIHCMAGVSRSVTLFLAYLIKQKGMSFNDAYNAVKRRRRIINPNKGFLQQLQKYQKQIYAKGYNPETQNSKNHRYEKSLGRKHKYLEDSSNLSFEKGYAHQQKTKHYDQDLWRSKQNNLNPYVPSYYNTVLQRNRKPIINNFIDKCQQIKTVSNQELAKQKNNMDEFFVNNKKRSSQKSFEQLNRQLDRRIEDIRQKYSDLAAKANSTGNNLQKNKIPERLFNQSKYDRPLKPYSVPKKTAYTSHPGLRTSSYYGHNPLKFDYYEPSLGGMMAYRNGYDKYCSMSGSYYEY